MSEPTPVPPSVRAQLLATEHWSLLATRSQTWGEVMSRIMAQFTGPGPLPDVARAGSARLTSQLGQHS